MQRQTYIYFFLVSLKLVSFKLVSFKDVKYIIISRKLMIGYQFVNSELLNVYYFVSLVFTYIDRVSDLWIQLIIFYV